MSTQVDQSILQEIRRRSDNFEQFFRSGDAAGLVNDYYVENPKLSAPDGPVMTNRADITDMFQTLIGGFSAIKLTQHDVWASGEMAYELGSARLTPKDPNGEMMDARYVIVWRKVRDGWRVELDFFASGKLD